MFKIALDLGQNSLSNIVCLCFQLWGGSLSNIVCLCFQLWGGSLGAADGRDPLQGDRCPGGGLWSGRQQTDPPHTIHLPQSLCTTHVW